MAAAPVDWRARGRRVKRFVIDNFLPLAFAVAIIWALAWPVPGKAVISVTVRGGGRLGGCTLRRAHAAVALPALWAPSSRRLPTTGGSPLTRLQSRFP